MASEVNPYRLQYIPQQDHSAELYQQAIEPMRFMQQQKENAFKMREADRADARDQNANERDRVSQEQRARQMLMEDKRAGQRESLYAKQEERRQADAMFNRNKLLQAEHETLIKEMYDAINTPGQDWVTRQNRIKAAQGALHRAGYGTPVNEDTPDGPTLPPAVAPMLDDPGKSTLPGHPFPTEDQGSSVAPMGNGGGAPPVPKLPAKRKLNPRDAAALGAQLDSVDPTQGLSALPPTRFLPGQSPIGPRPQSFQVAQSNAMLSPDDPLNNPPQ